MLLCFGVFYDKILLLFCLVFQRDFRISSLLTLRMIGYMYQHANVDLFKSRLLIEMIARTAKNVLRALMKFTYDSEKRVEQSSMIRYSFDFLFSFTYLLILLCFDFFLSSQLVESSSNI
jgi:hypothetical protein